MKTRKKELDVDFIGGNDPLTKEEERQITAVLKSPNVKLTRPASGRHISSKKKVIK